MNLFSKYRQDIPASIVVVFVAVTCLDPMLRAGG